MEENVYKDVTHLNYLNHFDLCKTKVKRYNEKVTNADMCKPFLPVKIYLKHSKTK
jgi:hypothetical protein